MQKAAFFDRDGVINDNSKLYYTYKIEDFLFIDGVVDTLKRFYDKGYMIIIITNQGGISKGEYSVNDVKKLNKYITEYLFDKGIKLTEIFFCPHHDKIENCLCRKPDSLMLEKAVAKYNIDTELSVMIGDSGRDIESASRIGLRAIHIESNSDMSENSDINIFLSEN